MLKSYCSWWTHTRMTWTTRAWPHVHKVNTGNFFFNMFFPFVQNKWKQTNKQSRGTQLWWILTDGRGLCGAVSPLKTGFFTFLHNSSCIAQEFTPARRNVLLGLLLHSQKCWLGSVDLGTAAKSSTHTGKRQAHVTSRSQKQQIRWGGWTTE